MRSNPVSLFFKYLQIEQAGAPMCCHLSGAGMSLNTTFPLHIQADKTRTKFCLEIIADMRKMNKLPCLC